MGRVVEGSTAAPRDTDLLWTEIDTIWGVRDGARIGGPHLLVLGVAAGGIVVGVGAAVPDGLAGELLAVASRPDGGRSDGGRCAGGPAGTPADPPPCLDRCADLLRREYGEVARSSGPSYLVPAGVSYGCDAEIVRSDGPVDPGLPAANPGNWAAGEWTDLLAGRLGPWAMARTDDRVVAICHTPARSARGAEAGVWTRPGYRGRGYAAAVTAAWAAAIRGGDRVLFYSTSDTNLSSQRVAARLRLRPIGWLWKLTPVTARQPPGPMPRPSATGR